MATLTITNNTSAPVLVQELYATISASGTLSTERTYADVMGMASFLAAVAAGTLSYTLAYSPAELLAGVDSSQESQLYLGVPDTASTTAIHASFLGDDASNDFPGAFTNPDVPRNIVVAFAASWDGGDVTVIGTDQFDALQTELIPDTASSTVVGAKMFKTVTAATKELVGAAAAGASIGHGDVLAIPASIATNGNLLFMDGVAEAGTFDAAENSVAPTTLPNGSRAYITSVIVG